MKWLLVLVVLSGCQRSPVDQEILLQIQACESKGQRAVFIEGEFLCRSRR